MQMQSRKPSKSLGLGRYSLLCHVCSTALMERFIFLFLSWPLDLIGWSAWPESFSFFCSLVSRVTSSARAYLLAMANIASNILGFFMVKDQGQIHESLLEEHDDKLVINLRGDIPLVAEA
jgi:hypothetical protein